MDTFFSIFEIFWRPYYFSQFVAYFFILMSLGLVVYVKET